MIEILFFRLLACVFIILCFVLYVYVRKLRFRLADTCMMLGQSATSEAVRRTGYMKALVFGEQRAAPFYYFSSLRSFVREQPLTPFIVRADGVPVPVVFYDYYIPSRYFKFCSSRQVDFVKTVWSWKDREDVSCFDEFSKCIEALHVRGIPTVIFMPTSHEKDNINRYSLLAHEMAASGEYNPKLDSVTYLYDRESKHTSRNRASIDSVSNIVVSPSIYGKECILVDDVCTSGASIRDHVQELRRYGVKVTGVVCLGRTVEYPEGSRIIYATALRDSNLSFLERVLNRIY